MQRMRGFFAAREETSHSRGRLVAARPRYGVLAPPARALEAEQHLRLAAVRVADDQDVRRPVRRLPVRHISPRTTVNENGERISEWAVPVERIIAREP
jgi:hypothetical protein